MAELNTITLLSDANLNAYYRFENANDTTANARNLTATGSPAYNAAKYFNGADLGASNSANGFDRNDTLGISYSTNFSISFWIKLQTEVASGQYDLIYWDFVTGASRYYILTYQYNSGTRRLYFYGDGGNLAYTVTLGTTDYHHIVVTVVPGGGATELWIDNVRQANGTSATGAGNGVDKLHIGKADTGSNWASAILDDMAFFSRVLTPTEISTLYNIRMASGGFFMAA
jgi:hypothetical protein